MNVEISELGAHSPFGFRLRLIVRIDPAAVFAGTSDEPV